MKMPCRRRSCWKPATSCETYWWIALSGLAAAAILWRIYTRTAAGRLWWDGARLRMPLLGDALLKAETSRFARAMATLVANTVPLVQSIGIAAATLNNRTHREFAGGRGATASSAAKGIAAPMRKAGVFPPLAAHLLTVGEETGRLDQMFARMADIYENDTRAAIRRFTSDFRTDGDPGDGRDVVGALILSMLLAITSINDVAV
jgi:general secretion pathway protein F